MTEEKSWNPSSFLLYSWQLRMFANYSSIRSWFTYQDQLKRAMISIKSACSMIWFKSIKWDHIHSRFSYSTRINLSIQNQPKTTNIIFSDLFFNSILRIISIKSMKIFIKYLPLKNKIPFSNIADAPVSHTRNLRINLQSIISVSKDII